MAIRNNMSDDEVEIDERSSPPITSLGYGIMARLAQNECSGYDLSLILGPPRNFLWEAKHSQIYPVLAELKKGGYVTYASIAQEGKPTRKVYRLTKNGLNELQHWAQSGPTRTPVRNEFFLKLAAIWTLPPEAAIAMLQKQVEMLSQEIDIMEGHMKDMETRAEASAPFPPENKYFGVFAATQLTRDTARLTLKECRVMIRRIGPRPKAHKRAKTKHVSDPSPTRRSRRQK
jgi:PadR family transcriptional regulator AphA